jgi:hypothetical protein
MTNDDIVNAMKEAEQNFYYHKSMLYELVTSLEKKDYIACESIIKKFDTKCVPESVRTFVANNKYSNYA